VVTCEIKLFSNTFEIISGLYFTLNYRRWLHVKLDTEIISKLFPYFISYVTTFETEIHLFRCWKSSEIISKLFQRHWTCWNIFMSCNPLK